MTILWYVVFLILALRPWAPPSVSTARAEMLAIHKPIKIKIEGYRKSSEYAQSVQLANSLSQLYPKAIEVETKGFESQNAWRRKRRRQGKVSKGKGPCSTPLTQADGSHSRTKSSSSSPTQQRKEKRSKGEQKPLSSSPSVFTWINDSEVIEGREGLMSFMIHRLLGQPRFMKAVKFGGGSDDDFESEEEEGDYLEWRSKGKRKRREKKKQQKQQQQQVREVEGPYDYDVVVIGGGSGGLAFSREASILGAKVALLDLVRPSWHGTVWGLGGTCVNVGCIPKKLMHQAALLREAMKEALYFGWRRYLPTSDGGDVERNKVDWIDLVGRIQNYIKSLNFKYRVDMMQNRVDYLNLAGRLKGPHEVEMLDSKGEVIKQVSARRIVIAVGGRPKPLSCPGAELAISSDDIFSMTHHVPGKTLVVGGSYVALECAGFLQTMGFNTTVMARSILLRGFDQEMAGKIGDYMASKEVGVKFIMGTVPKKLEEVTVEEAREEEEEGKTKRRRIRVSWEKDGQLLTEDFDTVLAAIGRQGDTEQLGLENAGVLLTKQGGKIVAQDEQSNVPHIYAIGDVVKGIPELTPAAVQAGRLLARRLYGGSMEGMDYDLVPTTVFTPLEYGACGLTEEAALERYGADNIEVYHKAFRPLEWALLPEAPADRCYVKVICSKRQGLRVVGFHILSPKAGEITQGFAVAMKLGLKYHDLRGAVGIHPTIAEEVVNPMVTKSSGVALTAGGC